MTNITASLFFINDYRHTLLKYIGWLNFTCLFYSNAQSTLLTILFFVEIQQNMWSNLNSAVLKLVKIILILLDYKIWVRVIIYGNWQCHVEGTMGNSGDYNELERTCLLNCSPITYLQLIIATWDFLKKKK